MWGKESQGEKKRRRRRRRGRSPNRVKANALIEVKSKFTNNLNAVIMVFYAVFIT